MHEWPGTPRFDETTELWTYQAALDEHLYPVTLAAPRELTWSLNLRDCCWPRGTAEMPTEDLERLARGIWPDLNRPLGGGAPGRGAQRPMGSVEAGQ